MVSNALFVTAVNFAVVTAVFVCAVVQEYKIVCKCYHQPLAHKNKNYLSSQSSSL